MSLYTDLLELFTPYANAIKSKADASSVYTKQQVDDAIDAITIPVDDTLSQTGEAADAKAVGDALSELNGSLDDLKSVNQRQGNIYDPTTAKDNIAVFSTDGAEHQSQGNCCSDFIDVSEYDSVELYKTTVICFYNSSKAKVSGQVLDTREEPVTIEVPEGAMYARFSTKMEQKETAYIGDGSRVLDRVRGKSISILFVGNSLTHDSVSYVPYILKTLFPDIGFDIHIFFNGGTTLATQYTRFVNDTPAANYSICKNDYAWKTYGNTHTMRYILETYKFDVVCMQDYFTFRSTFTVEDLEGWNNCQTFIEEHYTGGNPLKFVTLMPAPVRDNWTSQEHPTTAVVYAATVAAMKLIMKNTVAEAVIPCGYGIYKAMGTSLDQLGDMGHLSHDALHAQEGIPCLLQAYIVVLWILGVMEQHKSIYASPIRMTTAIYDTLNVPGSNVGTGVITGTDAENELVQEIAVQSYKEFTIPFDDSGVNIDNCVRYDIEQDKSDLSKSKACKNIGAVSKADINIQRDNLFDASTIISDTVVYPSSGNTATRAGWFASDFVDIGGLIYVDIYTNSNPDPSYYDSSKTYVKRATLVEAKNGVKYSYVIDRTGVKYIRFNGTLGKESNVIVTRREFTLENLMAVETDSYITPEKYGAVGDGITDDSAAFELAMRDGRAIHLGKKTYKANIYIQRDNVKIIGQGMESVIIPADTTKPVIKINSDSSETTADIIRRAELQDFKIYGNGSVVGIYMRCCQYCFITRVAIDKCYVEAIRLRGVFDSRIQDVSITVCGNVGFGGSDDGLGNYAITVDRITGMNTNAVAFLGMRIEQTPRCLKLRQTQQLMFTDCKFETHTTAYASDYTLAPINAEGTVKGVIFTNCVMTNSGLLSDQETELLSNGNPFVYTNISDITADGDEGYVLFSACQFRSQKTCKYFIGNYLHFIGCTFNRCAGNVGGNTLKKFSSLINCNIALKNSVKTLNIEGEQVIVDNVRINVGSDDSNTSVIEVNQTATRGKVSVIYNGSNRDNLATGTFNIPVEFVGLRKYEAS